MFADVNALRTPVGPLTGLTVRPANVSGETMARRRNLLSLIIAIPIIVGLSRLYRPHLDFRVGAALDLLLVAALFFAIRTIFARFEE
jgi:hypothetical protein